MSQTFSLRPVTAEDRDFLLQVYEAAREVELSMVPWDAKLKKAFVEHQFDAQTAHYASEFPKARHDVILTDDGQPVGRLYVNRTDDVIAILDITVLSEYRRQGFGSAVISALVDEARESDKAVRVYVETFNPSQQFFVSRGFVVEEAGELNIKLVWRNKKT